MQVSYQSNWFLVIPRERELPGSGLLCWFVVGSSRGDALSLLLTVHQVPAHATAASSPARHPAKMMERKSM